MSSVYLVIGNSPDGYDGSHDSWVEAVFESRASAASYADELQDLNDRVNTARSFQMRAMHEWMEENPAPAYKGPYTNEAVAKHQILAKKWNNEFAKEKQELWERLLGKGDVSALAKTEGNCPADSDYEVVEFEVRS